MRDLSVFLCVSAYVCTCVRENVGVVVVVVVGVLQLTVFRFL